LERCDWRHVNRFVVDYLRRDGLLLVRLVRKNVGDLTAAELLCALWNRHAAAFSVEDSMDARTGRRRKQQAARRTPGDGGKTLHPPTTAANENDAPVRHHYLHRRP